MTLQQTQEDGLTSGTVDTQTQLHYPTQSRLQHLLPLFDTQNETITSALARDPSLPVHKIVEQLYGRNGVYHAESQPAGVHDEHNATATSPEEKGGVSAKLSKLAAKLNIGNKQEDGAPPNQAAKATQAYHDLPKLPRIGPADLDCMASIGEWGDHGRPSDLFLQILARAVEPLQRHPLNGMVSPPLMASSGVIPLTILSVIPDIIEHHADLIVRAQHEVFLATNFWEASGAANTICEAMKELSRRVVEGNRPKVIFKMMYDRGNIKQMAKNHLKVEEKEWTGKRVKLPAREEIPGIDLEVVNYHDPPVGTFHAKYMVVDREIALVNSNNIQDRVNVEMMVHLEGPIVQSFYDMALISWNETLEPPLPLLAKQINRPIHDYVFGSDHPVIGGKDSEDKAVKARSTLQQHLADLDGPSGSSDSGQAHKRWDDTDADEVTRVDSGVTSESTINTHLSKPRPQQSFWWQSSKLSIYKDTGTKIQSTATFDAQSPFTPLFLHERHEPFPMAMVCRAPTGQPGHGHTDNPQDRAWLAAFEFATSEVFIQTPTFNAVPVVKAALNAVRRGIKVTILADLGFNDEGELLPYQGGTNEMVAKSMYEQLGSEDEKARLQIYWYTGKDQIKPVNAKDKSRNCHVKLMVVDGHVGIQGNGNQDTQSWFHSQEINIVIDSHQICQDWLRMVANNENTLQYGKIQHDGIWRDAHGNTLGTKEDPKPPSGPMKSLVGVKGAIQRVRGEGGF